VCVCVLAFPVRHAKRIRHAILSSVACPVVQYFSTLPRKSRGIREKVTEYKMRVAIFSTTVARNTSHLGRNGREMARNVHRSSCEVPVILVRFI
jgi:hypothetical protein